MRNVSPRIIIPFQPNVSFLFPLKYSERFSDVFRGIEDNICLKWAKNETPSQLCSCEFCNIFQKEHSVFTLSQNEQNFYIILLFLHLLDFGNPFSSFERSELSMNPALYLTPYKTNATGINYQHCDWLNYVWDLGTFKELSFKWIKFRQFYKFCLMSRKLKFAKSNSHKNFELLNRRKHLLAKLAILYVCLDVNSVVRKKNLKVIESSLQFLLFVSV